jgi:hypothetical protein
MMTEKLQDVAVRDWRIYVIGMHLFAAAVYHAMKEDGFDQ